MNITKQRITSILIISLMAPMLLGCTGSMFIDTPVFTLPPSLSTPVPVVMAQSNADYALAQATIDASHSQLQDLSRNSTAVSLNIAQAANAAAASTQDAEQRQKVELDYQATILSLNLAQAAATQEVIRQQTKMAGDASAAAQNGTANAVQAAYLAQITQTAQAQAFLDAQAKQTDQAAAALAAFPMTATYAAYALNVTETVQAQAGLNGQTTQTALAVAAAAVYPLTATPAAATQAAALAQEYAREQQSFVKRIVIPMVPYVATIDGVMLVLVIILAYRRYLHMSWPRRLNTARIYISPTPLIVINGLNPGSDSNLHPTSPSGLSLPNPPRLPSDNRLRVEIVAASEPPVAHWIAELEHQLANEGGI